MNAEKMTKSDLISEFIRIEKQLSAYREQNEMLRQQVSILDAKEKRYQEIADNTYDWEILSDKDGRLQWTNRSVERITGYTVEECYSMNDFPSAILNEEDRSAIMPLLQNLQANSTPSDDISFRIIRKDGSTRWVSSCWQPIIDQQGNIHGTRASLRDISRRKQTEEALLNLIEDLRVSNETISRQIYELNELKNRVQASERHLIDQNQKKDKFLSTISRDLLDTFMHFQSFIELIQGDFEQANKNLAGEMARQISESSRNAIRAIHTYFEA